MALETLRSKNNTPSGIGITHIQIRRVKPLPQFINADHINSELTFKIQTGPIKENGVNGCQVTDVIEVAKMIIETLNKKFPCDENMHTIYHLNEALGWQDKRTTERTKRGVEGFSKA